MSDSDRRPIIAIGVIVGALAALAAAVFIFGAPPLRTIPQRPSLALEQCGYQEARAAAQQARDARDAPSPRRSAITRAREAQRAEDAERNQAEAYECEQRLTESADLQAQWAAAFAASNASSVSLAQWRWSFVEFLALLATLGAAAWAATEARRAANAADTGNTQDERQSREQLRAYVVLNGFAEDKYPSGDKWYHLYSPLLRNCGLTPTRRLRYLLNQRVFREGTGPNDTKFADENTLGPSHFLIGPGLEVRAPGVLLSEIQLEQLRTAKEALYAWGWVDYDDVFEKTPRHRTEFCYRALILMRDGEYVVVWQPEGIYNSADEDCLRKPEPPFYPSEMPQAPGR